ncbi:MAG: DUF1467 family protein [Ahrensia sp.]|nr:DUF1467 family protein [Ahrensia sp.]
MQWLSAFAIFFIIWWTVLFTVLPIGVRSQREDNDIILGTESGAPTRANMRKKLLITTIIASIVFAVFYYVTIVLGFGIADLPSFVPDFGK